MPHLFNQQHLSLSTHVTSSALRDALVREVLTMYHFKSIWIFLILIVLCIAACATSYRDDQMVRTTFPFLYASSSSISLANDGTALTTANLQSYITQLKSQLASETRGLSPVGAFLVRSFFLNSGCSAIPDVIPVSEKTRMTKLWCDSVAVSFPSTSQSNVPSRMLYGVQQSYNPSSLNPAQTYLFKTAGTAADGNFQTWMTSYVKNGIGLSAVTEEVILYQPGIAHFTYVGVVLEVTLTNNVNRRVHTYTIPDLWTPGTFQSSWVVIDSFLTIFGFVFFVNTVWRVVQKAQMRWYFWDAATLTTFMELAVIAILITAQERRYAMWRYVWDTNSNGGSDDTTLFFKTVAATTEMAEEAQLRYGGLMYMLFLFSLTYMYDVVWKRQLVYLSVGFLFAFVVLWILFGIMFHNEEVARGVAVSYGTSLGVLLQRPFDRLFTSPNDEAIFPSLSFYSFLVVATFTVFAFMLLVAFLQKVCVQAFTTTYHSTPSQSVIWTTRLYEWIRLPFNDPSPYVGVLTALLTHTAKGEYTFQEFQDLCKPLGPGNDSVEKVFISAWVSMNDDVPEGVALAEQTLYQVQSRCDRLETMIAALHGGTPTTLQHHHPHQPVLSSFTSPPPPPPSDGFVPPRNPILEMKSAASLIDNGTVQDYVATSPHRGYFHDKGSHYQW